MKKGDPSTKLYSYALDIKSVWKQLPLSMTIKFMINCIQKIFMLVSMTVATSDRVYCQVLLCKATTKKEKFTLKSE